MSEYTDKSAVISDCGRYRYLLTRVWGPALPRVLWVMLNPSTADASEDDPTILSCVRLSKAAAFGGLEVANLFAWRATDPNELYITPERDGPENSAHIHAAAHRCALIVCAWGAFPAAKLIGRDLARALREAGAATFCYGATKHGQPRHPLYVATKTPMVEYVP